MATSSIFASFNINDNPQAPPFVTALEELAKELLRTLEAPTPHVLTDKEKIRNICNYFNFSNKKPFNSISSFEGSYYSCFNPRQ